MLSIFVKEDLRKLWKFCMVIKKIFKLTGKTKRITLQNTPITIKGISAVSTLIGRKKVESLKKIGKRKRDR